MKFDAVKNSSTFTSIPLSFSIFFTWTKFANLLLINLWLNKITRSVIQSYYAILSFIFVYPFYFILLKQEEETDCQYAQNWRVQLVDGKSANLVQHFWLLLLFGQRYNFLHSYGLIHFDFSSILCVISSYLYIFLIDLL